MKITKIMNTTVKAKKPPTPKPRVRPFMRGTQKKKLATYKTPRTTSGAV